MYFIYKKSKYTYIFVILINDNKIYALFKQ